MAENPSNNKNRIFIGAAVALIVALAGAGWLELKHKKASQLFPPSASSTISSIQNAFLPPATPAPPAYPPALTPSASATTAPRGTRTPAAKPVPAPQTFANQDLGFRLQLTADWQTQQLSANEVAIVSSTGLTFSVQVYPATIGLNDVQAQLQNSPSVTSLHATIFLGENALAFTTAANQQGLAVIHNSKLYYLMGDLSALPFTSFRFL